MSHQQEQTTPKLLTAFITSATIKGGDFLDQSQGFTPFDLPLNSEQILFRKQCYDIVILGSHDCPISKATISVQYLDKSENNTWCNLSIMQGARWNLANTEKRAPIVVQNKPLPEDIPKGRKCGRKLLDAKTIENLTNQYGQEKLQLRYVRATLYVPKRDSKDIVRYRMVISLDNNDYLVSHPFYVHNNKAYYQRVKRSREASEETDTSFIAIEEDVQDTDENDGATEPLAKRSRQSENTNADYAHAQYFGNTTDSMQLYFQRLLQIMMQPVLQNLMVEPARLQDLSGLVQQRSEIQIASNSQLQNSNVATSQSVDINTATVMDKTLPMTFVFVPTQPQLQHQITE